MYKLVFAALLFCLVGVSLQAAETAPPEKPGLEPVGSSYFPVPQGADVLEVKNAGFEAGDKPVGWSASNSTIVTGDAPEGKRFLRVDVPADDTNGAIVKMDAVPMQPNRYYLVSMWLRSEQSVVVNIHADVDAYCRGLSAGWHGAGPTGGTWKRVGVYFRFPATASKGGLMLRIGRGAKAVVADIDDVRLREAPFEEYATAFEAWCKQFPERDLSPRPGDGCNMPLAVRKLQGKGVPGKPFVIWAIGSSYTNFLGHGETLIKLIRDRFPDAPTIVYKKHVGNATPWQYNRGWVQQFVTAENPDVVLVYTIGRTEDLEAMVQNIRQTTTADIIVPSIHWRHRGKSRWGKSEDAPDQPMKPLRELADKYKVEFVESRREWAEHMKAVGWVDEYLKKTNDRSTYGKPGDLLGDPVHQSTYGALIILENIARHFAACDNPSYDPDSRERIVRKELTTSKKGDRIELEFDGNRVEVFGNASADGGTMRVLIDGKPAEQVPAFVTTYIAPGAKNAGPNWPRGDKAPHAVTLGTNLVAQQWTIRMLNNEGDFVLTGSVTGEDGRGNAAKPFTSRSGQIKIDPTLWRGVGKVRRGPNKGKMGYATKEGDTFTWEVLRGVASTVSFKGSGRVCLPVARMLDNGKHTVTLIAQGDGPVDIDGFLVCTPPLKE